MKPEILKDPDSQGSDSTVIIGPADDTPDHSTLTFRRNFAATDAGDEATLKAMNGRSGCKLANESLTNAAAGNNVGRSLSREGMDSNAWSNPLFHQGEMKFILSDCMNNLSRKVEQKGENNTMMNGISQAKNDVFHIMEKFRKENEDLLSVLKTLNSRFEKSKELVRNYRTSEEQLKNDLSKASQAINTLKTRERELNEKLMNGDNQKGAELNRLRAQAKMQDIRCNHLEEEVKRKQQENDQMRKLMHELTSK